MRIIPRGESAVHLWRNNSYRACSWQCSNQQCLCIYAEKRLDIIIKANSIQRKTLYAVCFCDFKKDFCVSFMCLWIVSPFGNLLQHPLSLGKHVRLQKKSEHCIFLKVADIRKLQAWMALQFCDKVVVFLFFLQGEKDSKYQLVLIFSIVASYWPHPYPITSWSITISPFFR